MPSFSDSIVLFILALILFGPKRLPALARELGKWVGEFRRASNEFKMQMEDELRQVEQAERLKKIEAMEAAAPKPPALDAPPLETPPDPELLNADGRPSPPPTEEPATEATEKVDGVLPIATSGELSIMPPATGLPQPREPHNGNALSGLVDSIPAVNEPAATTPETAANAH